MTINKQRGQCESENYTDEATAKAWRKIKAKNHIEPFYTNVYQNCSSRCPDYPPMVSKNTFKNEDRDKLITICLGAEDVEARRPWEL